MLFMKKIKKPAKRNTTKNKIVLILTVFCFVGVIYASYSNYRKIDGLPVGDEVNINTTIKNSYYCSKYVYNDDNGNVPANNYVIAYLGLNLYDGYDENGEYYVDLWDFDYLVRVVWNMTYTKEDIASLQEEQNFFREKLGSHFSDNINSDLHSDSYWLAASYDLNSEIPNATYDINFQCADLNMNDKGFQDVVKYLGLEFAYSKEQNAFTFNAWNKYLPYYDPIFHDYITSYKEIFLC